MKWTNFNIILFFGVVFGIKNDKIYYPDDPIIYESKERTAEFLQSERIEIPPMGTCTSKTIGPSNANLSCKSITKSCKATCISGYKFPNGAVILEINCIDNEWVVKGAEWPEIPSCEPICIPQCENNGICISPGKCKCAENYIGVTCRDRKQLCVSKPAYPKNSKLTCQPGSCTVQCMQGYRFANGATITNLKCLNGQWVSHMSELSNSMECQPICDPPCQNGGSCLSHNVCQCLSSFRGPQCQYGVDRCSPKKMGFNGGYNCTGLNDLLTCSLYCPKGIEFEFQPVQLYTCNYAQGYFIPTEIPQCVFPPGYKIVSTGDSFSSQSFEGTQHSGQTKHDHIHEMEEEEEDEDGSWETETITIVKKRKKPFKKKQKNGVFEEESGMYSIPGAHALYVSSDVDIIKIPSAGLCSTWGGVKVKTFDGLIYKAPLYCSHTLVQDHVDGSFSVILKACPFGSPQSCPHSLEIFLQNILYTFVNENGILKLSTPRKSLPIPVQIMGMKVTPVAQSLKIELETIGLVLLWDTKQHISVEANAGLWNRTSGLCGTLDKDNTNDFMSKTGVILKTPKTFVDSWKIKSENDPDKCLMDVKEEFDFDAECDPVKEKNATDICIALLSNPKLQNCFKVFHKSVIIEACISDYCNCRDPKNVAACNCEGLSVLSKECQFNGIKLERGWRNFDICPMNCNKGRVYLPCGPSLEPTCGSALIATDGTCHEGCFCPEGTVQHNDDCIPVELCPCILRNKEFKTGSTIKKDCNTCTCENGQWKCTDITCGTRCGAIGDPHYVTFDGKRYDFMGKCSYYLLKTKNFTVEAENVACPGSISEAMNFAPANSIDMPSCTKSVTIKLFIDNKEMAIKLKQGRLVYLNDKEITRYPKIIGDGLIIMRQPSSTMLSIDFADGVRVWWDGMTRVYIDAPASYRGRTQGLCGTFNSNTQDDFLTPEGDIESVVEPFADKWRTKDTCDYLSDTVTGPHPCQVNVGNKEKAEKFCMQLLDDIFENCHWSVDPEPFYEDCMYDVCACVGDLSSCYCPILAAYGAECSRQGINTNWRINVKECAIKCPVGQVYDECGDSCIRSCEDITNKDTCRGHCVEGCRCPSGQYLNDKNECVSSKLCPCLHDGFTFEPGYKEVRPGRMFLELCTCVGGAWDCTEAKPNDKELYPPAAEIKSKCANKPFAEFSKCVPNEPKTCKNMHDYIENFDDCQPGCICKAGYVFDTFTQQCVVPNDCSCHHGGKSYKDGDLIQEDCNKCKCKSGNWDCTAHSCASTCSVWGDSHFTTFDDREFDFQGACDYVLSKGSLPSGDGYSVYIQNVLCGSMGVTCSKSVKISITGSIRDSITLSADPSDKNSLQEHKKITTESSNSFTVYNAGVFTIIEVPSLKLQVKWDRGTRVYVKLANKWKGKVSGLCGNYNGDAQDDMKTPSLGLETSSLLFGHSWKLQEFCAAPTEQIDSCNEHPERKTWAQRKCGILKSNIFQPCHSEVSFEKYLKRCIFDACACDQGGDCECLCTAIAAYAFACSSKGIPIKWRTPELCPMQCDVHCSEYSACVPSCPVETCDNYMQQGVSQQICSTETCFEGCQIKPCENGKLYLNDSFLECVPKAKCKPICLEKNGVMFYEGDITYSDDCQTCRCTRKKEICSGAPCVTLQPPLLSESGTPQTPSLTQPLDCTYGWTDWKNQDEASPSKIGINIGVKNKQKPEKFKQNDVEPLPKYLELQSIYGFGACRKQFMKKIECRVVKTHETPEDTGDNVECNLEKGLLCIGQCHDYEIRVLCECDTSILINNTICDPLVPHVESPDDCYKFLHCQPQTDGTFKYAEKTCGPSMMYNPKTMVCDHISVVTMIKPECSETKLKSSTPTPSTHAGIIMEIPPKIPTECVSKIPHIEYPGDCSKFLHCEPQMNGIWEYVEKKCNIGTLFNPISMICDHQANVETIKPECTKMPIPVTESASYSPILKCPPGEHLSKCALPCGKACHYYGNILVQQKLCKPYSNICEEGCVNINLPTSCPPNKLWRDKTSCVEIADCPCISHSGKLIKPHETFQESDCEICQCIDNSYVCSKSACVVTEQPIKTSTIMSIGATSTEKPIILIPETKTPPKKCDPEQFIPMINGDVPLSDQAFSASSNLGSSFLPKYSRLHNKPTAESSGSWSPKVNDQMQYLQVSFSQPTPVYGIIAQGSPIFDQYVTRFKILHSYDDIAYHYLVDELEQPQIFNGPIDSRTPVESLFKIPIEAKTIRIYPLKWHEGIAMRIELLGCSSIKTPSPPSTPGYDHIATPSMEIEYKTSTYGPSIKDHENLEPVCVDYMGLDNNKMSPPQVNASSISPDIPKPELFDLLKLTTPNGWRPALNSPNEYISFDFLEPRNITGITTKGGSKGWVTAYTVKYSKNGRIWNQILIPNGQPKIFLANHDFESTRTNYFQYPIQAQYLRIAPNKWYQTIEMRVEPIGCFRPYPIPELPFITSPPLNKTCPICPDSENISPGSLNGLCKCEEPLYWDGKICVQRDQCPCIVGHMPYNVGAKYASEDCMECVCVLGGNPQCKLEKCPPCTGDLRPVHTPTCQCTCESCPEFQRLCPSSGDCIPEMLWCNGVADCGDDELDCEEKVTISPDESVIINIKNITKECPEPSCPPGMTIRSSDSNRQRKMSPIFETSVKTTRRGYSKTTKTYRKTTNNYETNIPTIQNSVDIPDTDKCFEFVCVPDIRPTIQENTTKIIKCPRKQCPENYDIEIISPSKKSNECSRYTCIPRAQKDAICYINGRTFRTFDDTEYKYDICSHILARDLIGDRWSIILNKNCTTGNYICHKELIIKDKDWEYVIVFLPDLSVILNGFPYTVRQLETSSYAKSSFIISQPGNTILFVSKSHGFWVSYDDNGSVKVGVSSKYIKTVDGLCGYYNGIPSDDKRLPNGKPADNTVMFGDGWFTGDIPKSNCEPHACPKHLQDEAWNMCNSIKHESFGPCFKTIDVERFVSKCLETTCECLKANGDKNQKSKDCKCEVLENFVKECLSTKPDVHLETWRSIHNCEISCPIPFVHKDCYKRRCELSCDNMNANDCPILPNLCFSGCYCPEGTVRKGETCVPVIDCKDCICDSFGTSKYVTYDRQNFTFDGNCTYLLTRDVGIPGVHTFQVYVTMGTCNADNAFGQSIQLKTHKTLSSNCAKSLHILHGEHIIHIQRGAHKSIKVFLDGMELRSLPYRNELVYVRQDRGKQISVEIPQTQIEVISEFDDNAFSIKVPGVKYRTKMEGLCGDCNGDPNNDLVLNPKKSVKSSGNPLRDIIDSWQADEPKLGLGEEDCMSQDEPLHDCIPLPPEVDPCMKLLDDNLFGQCHLIVDPIMYISICQQDICKPGSDQTGACESLTAYARECSRHGICLDWRQSGFCPYECPPFLQYEPCGCTETCETIKNRELFEVINMNTKSVVKGKKTEKMCQEEKAEGCYCPLGFVLSNKTCIPEMECIKCDENHYPGEFWTLDKCTECVCNKDGKTTCTKQDCPVQEKICEEGYISVETSKESECCRKFICVPKPTQPPSVTCSEPPLPVCGLGQDTKSKTGPDGCIQYVCECKPSSECPILDTELPLKTGEKVILQTSGCCPSQKIVCDKKLCPPKPKKCDEELYALVENKNANDCCPTYKCVPPKNTCVVTINGIKTLKKAGDKWAVPNEPCVHKVCSYGLQGTLIEIEEQEMCDINCDKGYKYTAEPGKCCGKCIANMCKDNDKFYKSGQTWYSEDNCTSHSCVIKDDQFYIVSSEELCPDIFDCPENLRYKKGCCMHCKLTSDSQKNCMPEPLEEAQTIELVQVYQQNHGLCTNKEAIKGFTECHGSCKSGSKFNMVTFGQDKICDCCSVKSYEFIEVPLKCKDEFVFKKLIQIPSVCSCEPCADSEASPLLDVRYSSLKN